MSVERKQTKDLPLQGTSLDCILNDSVYLRVHPSRVRDSEVSEEKILDTQKLLQSLEKAIEEEYTAGTNYNVYRLLFSDEEFPELCKFLKEAAEDEWGHHLKELIELYKTLSSQEKLYSTTSFLSRMFGRPKSKFETSARDVVRSLIVEELAAVTLYESILDLVEGDAKLTGLIQNIKSDEEEHLKKLYKFREDFDNEFKEPN